MKRLVCIPILVGETRFNHQNFLDIQSESKRFNSHFCWLNPNFQLVNSIFFILTCHSGAGTVAECTGSGSVAGIRWRCAVGGLVALSYIYMYYVYVYMHIYIYKKNISLYVEIITDIHPIVGYPGKWLEVKNSTQPTLGEKTYGTIPSFWWLAPQLRTKSFSDFLKPVGSPIAGRRTNDYG